MDQPPEIDRSDWISSKPVRATIFPFWFPQVPPIVVFVLLATFSSSGRATFLWAVLAGFCIIITIVRVRLAWSERRATGRAFWDAALLRKQRTQ